MRDATHRQVAGSSDVGDGKSNLQLPQGSAGQHGSIHHVAGEGAGRASQEASQLQARGRPAEGTLILQQGQKKQHFHTTQEPTGSQHRLRCIKQQRCIKQ